MTVVQKQRQLQFLGYYTGKIDGLWGVKSEAATRALQEEHGLVVDGIFGAKTEAKTMQLVMDIQKTVGANIDGLVGSETYAKYNAYKNKKPDTTTVTSGGIKKYSFQTDGDTQLSANFHVYEFRSKDGADDIYIDSALVDVLQRIRDHFGVPVGINSAYRTKAHNAAVGGASNSQHLYGRAADIVVSGVSPATVAAYAETLMPNTGGIGIYSWGVHVDTRDNKGRWRG